MCCLPATCILPIDISGRFVLRVPKSTDSVTPAAHTKLTLGLVLPTPQNLKAQEGKKKNLSYEMLV